MIPRSLKEILKKSAQWARVISIVGPRQSGKTTLAQDTFSDYRYISLEDPTNREFAKNDPRGFLENAQKNQVGIILDEFQYVPELLSYIQLIVDQSNRTGYFVLTGSQNFLANQAVSQSLAGRVALFTLLPLSFEEIAFEKNNLEYLLLHGFYPQLYINKNTPLSWYTDYITTYVERDVRQLQAISDISLFQNFIKLCAGRVGQLLNLTSLGNDCGVSHNTARSWISILENSYIIFLMQPYFKNFNKRIIKSPKLYFYDTGLLCNLLSIKTEEQLFSHYAKGSVFESAILGDFLKQYYHHGQKPDMYFFADRAHEVDCILERANNITAIEIKSGKTIQPSFFDSINYFKEIAGNIKNGYVVYAGDESQKRSYAEVVAWSDAKNLISQTEK